MVLFCELLERVLGGDLVDRLDVVIILANFDARRSNFVNSRVGLISLIPLTATVQSRATYIFCA